MQEQLPRQRRIAILFKAEHIKLLLRLISTPHPWRATQLEAKRGVLIRPKSQTMRVYIGLAAGGAAPYELWGRRYKSRGEAN